MTTKIFTYGTLRNGKEPTHKLPGYMMFAVQGKLFNFPVIQPYPWTDSPPAVAGNVIEVSDEELQQLDKYEGVERGLYVRTEVVVYELGKSVAKPEIVQAYIGGPALVNTPIPSGVWEQS